MEDEKENRGKEVFLRRKRKIPEEGKEKEIQIAEGE